MTKEKVLVLIYSWGYYSCLVLLRELEHKEDYESCAIVKSAMDEVVKLVPAFKTDTSYENLKETLLYVTSESEAYKNNVYEYVLNFKKSFYENK